MIRWGLSIAAVVLLFAAVPASADPVGLTAHTHLTGSDSGYVEVSLPAPVQPIPADNPSGEALRIVARGGYAVRGFLLRGEFRRADGSTPQMLGLANHSYDEPVHYWGWTYRDGYTGDSPSNILPAGRYRLYLLTWPHSPLTIDFDLPSLPAGETAVSPERLVAVEARDDPTLHSDPFSSYAGSSGSISGPGDGLYLEHQRLHAEPGLWRSESCISSDPADRSAAAYSPGCRIRQGDPGGESLGPQYTPVAGEGSNANWLAPGLHGFGWNYSIYPGPAPQFKLWQEWVSLDDPLPATATVIAPAARLPAAISLAAMSAPVAAGAARVRLLCSGPQACAGTARIAGARRVAFAAPARSATTARLPLTARIRARLSRHSSIRAEIQIASSGAPLFVRTLRLHAIR